MARVTVEDCIDKIPNRFNLVMTAAQRARQIAAGAPLTLERDDDKNPVVALREIADETIDIEAIEQSLIQGLQKHVDFDEPEEDDILDLLESEQTVPGVNTEIAEGAAKIDEGAAEIDEGAAKIDEGAANTAEGAAKIAEGAAEIAEGAAEIDVKGAEDLAAEAAPVEGDAGPDETQAGKDVAAEPGDADPAKVEDSA